MKQRIGIVGAGVGGLACAARLASRGYEVEVYEKLPRCGGRNNIIEDKGFKFDTGPSFVLMPGFFKEVFDYCGQKSSDYLDLRVLDVNYKIFYPDGDTLTVYKDNIRTKEELERIESSSSRAYDTFLEETERIYNLIAPLLYNCFTASSVFNPRYWPLVARLNALQSYWQLASRFFRSEKLRYAFTFEAMFMGVSPFEAPAFYSIITYADHVQKIAHPMGGMYQIPLALEKLAKSSGAKFHYGSEVDYFPRHNGKVAVSVSGNQVEFDKVVVNADYAYAMENLFRQQLPEYRYSCSVYLIYLGLKRKLPAFQHHNLFFAEDLKKNLRQIFQGGQVPEDPSFYVHVPTVTDVSLAPPGKDIFYVLIPVPNLKLYKGDFLREEEQLRKVVFKKINAQIGIDLESLIEVEHRFYPEDFIKRYNIKYGATFGLAHNLLQSAFFRPANYDPRLKGVYFAGASTQPGGGLPVVIAGSRIVADLIQGGKN